ncbi:MAG: LON peptidase substrate-binding domain-containing protein [Chloroflexota bacterium]|nr:LON peptidase substrate-binding domain-containing protein [Dehalococcoidia bacterium]MDW8047317.1 LON peptidase substrate-binding domain-containing protein [Chloroflexota bacterium]
MAVELPLFPLRTVLVPGMVLPLQIFEHRYRVMLEELLERGGEFGVLLIREGPEVGGEAVTYEVGTTARFDEVEESADGRYLVTVRGRRRFRLLERLPSAPYPRGLVEFVDEPAYRPTPASAAAEARLRAGFPRYFAMALALTGQWSQPLKLPEDPARLADFLVPWLQLDEEAQQRLLELIDPGERLIAVAAVVDELVARTARDLEEQRRTKFRGLGADN